MKVPQHPHVAKAQAALERGDSDAAWHLLRAVPKDFLEVPDTPAPPDTTKVKTRQFVYRSKPQ